MGHLFISYSHKDTGYAHKLAGALQNKGLEVWIDERLDYGSQWPLEIQKQLDSCSAFIVVMTPRAFASEWVQSELQRAKRKLKPVFPLLLEGDEPWLSVESTQYYDVRGKKLPDEKFFSALMRVAAVQGAELPSPEPAPVSVTEKLPVLRKPKLKSWYTLAIAGVVVTALVALLPALLDRYSPGSTPDSPDQPSGSESATDVPDQGPQPDPASDSGDFIDGSGVFMRFVPADEFTMGIDAEEALSKCQETRDDCVLDWFTDEAPPHQVYLDDFFIDKFEVTNALYRDCVDEGVCDPPTRTDSNTRPSYYDNSEFDDYPVIYVGWDMAETYCEWRGGHLPTEAQWERAARGTDERTYPWGEGIDSTLANYAQYGSEDTTPVGAFEGGASPYGVYDMAGNVWEWGADWYSDSYYRDSPPSNPPGPDSGDFRVLRGGSWDDDGAFLRVSIRGRNDPEVISDNGFGFRCVWE